MTKTEMIDESTTASSTAAAAATKVVAQKEKDSTRKFFTSHFPADNVSLFESEKELLTSQYEKEIERLYTTRDIATSTSRISKKSSKLQLLYGISGAINSKLSETLLHLALEEGYTKVDSRIVTASLKTSSTLNW